MFKNEIGSITRGSSLGRRIVFFKGSKAIYYCGHFLSLGFFIENADGIEELRILFKNVDSLELYANLVYIKEVGNIATTINFADVVARDMLHDRYVLYSRYVNKKKKGIKF